MTEKPVKDCGPDRGIYENAVDEGELKIIVLYIQPVCALVVIGVKS